MISSDTGFFTSDQSCSEWSRQLLDEAYARAMEEVAQRYPDDLHAQTLAAADRWMSVPYNARMRYGQWQTILKETPPSEDLRYITGMWHYCPRYRTGGTRAC